MEILSTHPVPSFVAGFLCGLVGGYFIVKPKNQNIKNFDNNSENEESEEETDDEGGEYKMVLVVRTDLKMGKGKAAAQCAHAAVAAVKSAYKKKPKALHEWMKSGQAKIVVKIETEKEMLELADEARQAGLCVSIISDAGRTQIAAGSKTVMAVGPGSDVLINEVTGHLKLY